MLSLALETSTRRASAALGIRGTKPVFAALGGERPHLSELMPLIASLFKKLNASARELDCVFVGIGPGSYTGLRVGISCALGLSVGPSPPKLFGIASSETLLFEALSNNESGLWLSDARSETWYHSRANKIGAKLTVNVQPELIGTSEVVLLENNRVFTDPTSFEALEHLLAQQDAPPPEIHEPQATALLALGLLRLEEGLKPCLPTKLAPLYLREFAAKVRSR